MNTIVSIPHRHWSVATAQPPATAPNLTTQQRARRPASLSLLVGFGLAGLAGCGSEATESGDPALNPREPSGFAVSVWSG